MQPRQCFILYALPVPMLYHSPLSIPGLPLCILVYLSACAHILQGDDWYRARDHIRLGLEGLKKIGEVWASARKLEKETKQIARSVLQPLGPVNQATGGLPVDFYDL